MARVLCVLVACALVTAAFAQRGDKRDEPRPENFVVPPAPVLTPAKEAATFKLAPGFHAELVAAAPLIGDPVAIQFAPDGRLWVVERRGFIRDADVGGGRDSAGVVAVLTDTDGDGRYDRRSVFADQLVMPRALALVGGGVLVADPPHRWFLQDTDGDGAADRKTEIAADEIPDDPERPADGLLRALDNWIYAANHAVRYRWLGEGRFAREPTIRRGEGGITQDDVGRIYYAGSGDPLRVDAIPPAYLERNPQLAAEGANLRVAPGAAGGDRTLSTESNLATMTSASGAVVYRGALFPEEFRGDVFVAKPAANRINRIELTETDGVVTGANTEERVEFMTSSDERFRPVNLNNGPDGALYVVDFHGGSTRLRPQTEQRGLGEEARGGRIWRIAPVGASKPDFRLKLDRTLATELVGQLGSPHGWVRDTAQRLLVERRDPVAVAPLRDTVRSSARPPLARLHALWTLEGSGDDALDPATLAAALDDPDPRVCAAAVRLSERFLRPAVGDAGLAEQIISLVQTRSEPAVRLQLALTLGELKSEAGDRALRALIAVAGRQPLLADAVVSGLAGRETEFIEAIVKGTAAVPRAGEALRLATSAVLKSRDAARIERTLGIIGAEITPEWVRIPMLAGVRRFLPKAPDGHSLIGALPAEPKPLVALAARKDSPAAPIAQQLLAHLTWPGKPGAARK